jgi:hypothetical protein
MPITKDASVLIRHIKVVNINLADVVSAADQGAIDLPPNSVVLSGNLCTTEAWNSTSTDVFDVGDAGSQNRYLNDGNIRSLAALVALVPTGYIHPGGPITVRWTSGGGSPTTGKLRMTVDYITLGQASGTYEY